MALSTPTDFKTTSSGGTLTAAAMTVAVGDVIVVKIVTEDAATIFDAPTATGITFGAAKVSSVIANTCAAYLYAAAVASGTSITVTATVLGSTGSASMVVERWAGAQLAATPAVNSTKQSVQANGCNGSVTTVANGSVVSWVAGDWGAHSPAGVTYRSSATQEYIHDVSPNKYVGYHASQVAVSAGAQSFGVSTTLTSSTWTYLGIEIQDAGGGPPPPGPLVDSRAAGSTTFYSPGTTAVATAAVSAINPLVPVGTTTDDLCVLTVVCKPYGTLPTTPAGWTKIGEATNGTVAASAADLGSMKVALYVRTGLTGGSYIGAIARTGTTANSMAAVINSYSKVEADSTWGFSVFATGGDTTQGANFSATPSNSLDLAAGDMLVVGIGVNSDLGTFSAQSFGTYTGATLTGLVVRAAFDVTTGFDCRIATWDAHVTAGSSTATPATTATNASTTSGTAMWLRLREVLAAVVAAPVQQPMWHMQAVHRATEW